MKKGEINLINDAEKIFKIREDQFKSSQDFRIEVTKRLINKYNSDLPKLYSSITTFDRILNWNMISESNIIFTEDFLSKHRDRLNWGEVSKNPNLTEDLIEKFIKDINWFSLTFYRSLSPEFIFKYHNNLPSDIIITQHITKDLLIEILRDNDWRRRLDTCELSIYPIFDKETFKLGENIIKWDFASEFQPFILDAPKSNINFDIVKRNNSYYMNNNSKLTLEDYIYCFTYKDNPSFMILDGYEIVHKLDNIPKKINTIYKSKVKLKNLLSTLYTKEIEIVNEIELTSNNKYKRIK